MTGRHTSITQVHATEKRNEPLRENRKVPRGRGAAAAAPRSPPEAARPKTRGQTTAPQGLTPRRGSSEARPGFYPGVPGFSPPAAPPRSSRRGRPRPPPSSPPRTAADPTHPLRLLPNLVQPHHTELPGLPPLGPGGGQPLVGLPGVFAGPGASSEEESGDQNYQRPRSRHVAQRGELQVPKCRAASAARGGGVCIGKGAGNSFYLFISHVVVSESTFFRPVPNRGHVCLSFSEVLLAAV